MQISGIQRVQTCDLCIFLQTQIWSPRLCNPGTPEPCCPPTPQASNPLSHAISELQNLFVEGCPQIWCAKKSIIDLNHIIN